MLEQKRGFTLIELMITVAIIGILAGIAAPAFQAIIKNNRLATDTNDLIADLAMAKSEAVKRGVRVTICSSSNGTSCLLNANANWSAGRILFVDPTTAGTLDAGEQVIKVSPGTRSGVRLTASSFSNASFMQYRPRGNTDSVGSFKLCDDRAGAFGRTISVNTAGRASLTATNATCP